MTVDIVAFLADSLALWQVEGDVIAGNAPVVAVVHARGSVIAIERNDNDDVPWRWFVRWTDSGSGGERSRPCPSLTGLLNALRRALDVERGSAVRVVANAAPAPLDSLPCVSGGGPGRGQA
jgi:hypothetical protein